MNDSTSSKTSDQKDPLKSSLNELINSLTFVRTALDWIAAHDDELNDEQSTMTPIAAAGLRNIVGGIQLSAEELFAMYNSQQKSAQRDKETVQSDC